MSDEMERMREVNEPERRQDSGQKQCSIEPDAAGPRQSGPKCNVLNQFDDRLGG